MATDLVVALDFNEQATADHMIDQLQGMKLIYKVGLELYLSADPKWVENLCVRERVFGFKTLRHPNDGCGGHGENCETRCRIHNGAFIGWAPDARRN